jgi:hypothetical protein
VSSVHLCSLLSHSLHNFISHVLLHGMVCQKTYFSLVFTISVYVLSMAEFAVAY